MSKLLALFLLIFSFSVFAGNEKVDVCHIPPGNPDNAHTINVSENAVSAHLAHGDYLGACAPTSSAAEFYPCNVGIRHRNTFNGTATSHDYVTYSYSNIDGTGAADLILEAKRNSYDFAFNQITAFSKKLEKVKINLSSERMGTDYYVDFCFDGRADNGSKGLRIEDVTHISSNPFPITVSRELYCDIHNRENGRPDLSRISLSGGFPISFNKVPEFCTLRFHVIETNIGEARNWSRSFNRISTFIESEIISQ